MSWHPAHERHVRVSTLVLVVFLVLAGGCATMPDPNDPEAVAEFNRYRQAPILVVDPKVASLRVGGRFGLKESDQFLEALRSGFGIKVAPRADGAVEILADGVVRAPATD